MADTERYDWGIYNGIGVTYDYKDKERNIQQQARYMLNRSLNMFEYHNLPDTIPPKELERLLQTNGFAGITEVEGELYAFYGGLGGEQDVYGRATTMTVSNPALRYNETLKIGEDVVLMRNDDMLQGLIPIYSRYLTILNETEVTMMLSLINKRANNLISVTDDNTAESARQYLKKLEEGELGYIFENKLYDSLKTNPTREGSGTSLIELIEFAQYTKANMYNEIGLNANFNMKRERLIQDEIEMNTEALYPLVDNMLYNRRLALEKVNEWYGTDIKVEFNSSWDYRVNDKERTEVDPESDTGIESVDDEPIDRFEPNEEVEQPEEQPEGLEDISVDELSDVELVELINELDELETMIAEDISNIENFDELDEEEQKAMLDELLKRETERFNAGEPLGVSQEAVEEPQADESINIDVTVENNSEAVEEPVEAVEEVEEPEEDLPDESEEDESEEDEPEEEVEEPEEEPVEEVEEPEEDESEEDESEED